MLESLLIVALLGVTQDTDDLGGDEASVVAYDALRASRWLKVVQELPISRGNPVYAAKQAASAQRFDELDQVAGNSVRRQRLRRAGSSNCHQCSPSSGVARHLP